MPFLLYFQPFQTMAIILYRGSSILQRFRFINSGNHFTTTSFPDSAFQEIIFSLTSFSDSIIQEFISQFIQFRATLSLQTLTTSHFGIPAWSCGTGNPHRKLKTTKFRQIPSIYTIRSNFFFSQYRQSFYTVKITFWHPCMVVGYWKSTPEVKNK